MGSAASEAKREITFRKGRRSPAVFLVRQRLQEWKELPPVV